MFVDNTDLFFSGKTGVPDEEFLARVQEGINDWANMVISTGGNIKITKSHAKVSMPVWTKGHCRTRKLSRLPTRSFTIPQRDKSVKSIKVLDYKVAKKSLGVMFTGDGKTTKEHTKWMAEKGKKWTDTLRSKGYMMLRDGWKSLNTQLKPRL